MSNQSFLVGDAGGTSTDWRLFQDDRISQFKTSGFNAYLSNLDSLIEDIKDQPFRFEEIERTFFYAAGIETSEQKKLVLEKLGKLLPNIKVENDLLGVARSLCGNDQGYIGILGTGSNACSYDGEKVDKVSASLGYILGDEGSGGNMGKRLLAKVFRKQLEQSLIDAFQDEFKLSSNIALETLYNHPSPNQYLASFSRFIERHKNHPEIYQLIYSSFNLFFDAFFPNVKDLSIHFCGSIAHYFSDILRQVAIDRSFQIQNIVQSPIAGLVLYHQNNAQ